MCQCLKNGRRYVKSCSYWLIIEKNCSLSQWVITSVIWPHKPKMVKKLAPQGRPSKGVKWEGQIWVIFYRISCLPLETTFLHRSTPLLRQITSFGGIDFLWGLIVRVQTFPLLNLQNLKFSAHFGLRNFCPELFTMGTLQSKLPLIII